MCKAELCVLLKQSRTQSEACVKITLETLYMDSYLRAVRARSVAAGPSPIPYVPRPTYGCDLLSGLDPSLRSRAVVCTQPEPWEQVKEAFDEAPVRLHFVTDVDHAEVRARCQEWVAALGSVSAVFGIGGGSALDHAKYASNVLNAPLVLCPSILSVDAGYTVAAGVREVRPAGKTSVVYVGDARPTALLIDYKLLQAAPPVLNRSGVGDLLSCWTALWDWTEAHARLGEPFDPLIADRTRALLERLLLESSGRAVRDVSDEGLRLLSDEYVEEVTLCEMWGNARPEEGSEHYVAYALEALTGKHYLHGQLIALCVVLVGAWQGQDVQRIVEFVRAIELDCSLQAVGTTREELHEVLTTMGDFVASEPQLLPGVFHFKGSVPPDEATALLDIAEAAFVPLQVLDCEECPPCGDASNWWSCARCRNRRSR